MPSTLPMAMWFALTSYHWAFFIWLCWWLLLGLSKRRTVVCGWPSPGRSQDDLYLSSQDKMCFSLSFSVKNIPLIHYLDGELYYFLSRIFVIYTLFLNELMTLYFKQCSLPYGPFSITMRLKCQIGRFFLYSIIFNVIIIVSICSYLAASQRKTKNIFIFLLYMFPSSWKFLTQYRLLPEMHAGE